MYLKEDIKKLFEGADLPEELNEKIAIQLESLIGARVRDMQSELQESNKLILEAEKELMYEAQLENLDKYASHVAQEYLNENRLIAEDAIQVDAANDFMRSIKEAAEKHGMAISERKGNSTERYTSKIQALEEQLSRNMKEKIEQTSKISVLENEMREMKKDHIITSLTESLTETQKERLSDFISDIPFNDEATYKKKVSMILEAHFVKGDGNHNTLHGRMTKPNRIIESSSNSWIDMIAEQI